MRLSNPKNFKALFDLAMWTRAKYLRQLITSGTYQAARNMRKQGYPIELALSVLAGRV